MTVTAAPLGQDKAVDPGPADRPRRRRRDRDTAGWPVAVLGWLGSLLLFSPIAYMLLKSFQTETDAAAPAPKLAFHPTLEHYQDAFQAGFWAYAGNSIAVAAVSTILVLLLAVPAAYALAVRPVRKAQDALFFFISTKMMPVAAGIIPIYVVAQRLGLLNTVVVLVILHLGMNLPLAIWMIRSFLQEVPGEVLEAAALDGAGRLRTMRSIVLPLVRPGLWSTALLCCVFSWNEYFYAVNLTTTTSTLPLFMQKFLSFGELYTAQVAAVATVVSIPVVILGWICQRSLVRGLLFGAVK
ncbi:MULTISPECIES: carbohydrate ABC transporter permease [unclassified Pseudofrankia]|uniref:carbohydrate ABC transporter permease n=1 Tax=unclassified Pseudofrankia TaxID=2994372 RepID=UPI0008DB16AC|nr:MULTISPECIES: carbohydrate ABC transporter permease [unclassified Pseudofrankia]MDT3442286.1 carbohydrate ABC transporter permease [Pseudofrankia sp. BMG5.37]OHV60254.1 sugar ABC transporter permease [Pseudofrankia sp. BMG5.36]